MNRLILYLLCLIGYLGVSSGHELDYYKRSKIKSPSGEEVFSAKFYEKKIKVEVLGRTLETAATAKDGKRKYSIGDEVYAEVKFSDDGFKLRTKNGDLLWKVKIQGDEIEMADNEEMTATYQIRKSGEKLKLGDDGKDVAEVKWYSDNRKLKLKTMDGTELFVAKTNRISATIAILGCKRILATHQAILMTELEVLEK